MNERSIMLLIGLGICTATVLAMRFAWTPKKNVWWDRDPDGWATLATQRVVIVLAFFLGILFILGGTAVFRTVPQKDMVRQNSLR